MTTVRYARFVIVNLEKCSIIWHESRPNAEKEKRDNGGTLYDFDTDDPITIENTLQSARQRMGVE